MTDKLHIREADADAKCAVCSVPSSDLARHIVSEARRLHGHGGLNVCKACIQRAIDYVKRTREDKG